MTVSTKKFALFVGGASDIGFATARQLAAEGAIVFLTGRDPDSVAAAARDAGADDARGCIADAGMQV